MKKVIFAGVAVAALIAIPAVAQPDSNAPGRQDGPLTRASVQASVQARFAKADSNNDGFITRAEADAKAAEARARFAERRAERQTRRAEMKAGMFDRIDTDKNGSISRAEFDAHHAARAEHAGERRGPEGGRAGRRGMRHARMMGHGGMGGGQFVGAMFDRLDADKDGRVSLAEASTRALQMFDNADVNRDGTVTMEERRAARERFREERRSPDG